MTLDRIKFTVFTKPWRERPLAEIARHVQALGLAGVELPVRPGFQVEPAKAARDLPEAVRLFADHGLEVASIGSAAEPAIIEACGGCGVRLIRVMPHIPEGENYLDAERRFLREYEAVVPALEAAGVALGLQHHEGRFVTNASGLRRLLDHFDPRHVGAVWDPAHCALSGEIVPFALDLLWSHLKMVNLKNPIYRRTTGPEAAEVEWRRYWTSGRQGLVSWSEVARELKARGFAGNVLLFNEYADEASVDRLLAEDVAYAREVFARACGDGGTAAY